MDTSFKLFHKFFPDILFMETCFMNINILNDYIHFFKEQLIRYKVIN